MNQDWIKNIENEIRLAILNELEEKELTPKQIEELWTEVFEESKSELVDLMVNGFKKSAKYKLKSDRKLAKGFEKRNFKRWELAFDHIDLMWCIAREIAEAHRNEIFRRLSDGELKSKYYLATALDAIMTKSLLVVQEIICLLRAGFPDGAMSRWRMLHELNVTTQFIFKHGEDRAREYVLSYEFSRRRAALQINSCSERSQLKEFSEDEMAAIDRNCEYAENLLGRKVKTDRDGEWPKITQNFSTFAQLEEDVGLDHWRPYYKCASLHNHAVYRKENALLGLIESTEPQLLVGASNSGFVDPLQLTALSLSQIFSTYMLICANEDRIIYMLAFDRLAVEMYEIACESEKASKANLDKIL